MLSPAPQSLCPSLNRTFAETVPSGIAESSSFSSLTLKAVRWGLQRRLYFRPHCALALPMARLVLVDRWSRALQPLSFSVRETPSTATSPGFGWLWCWEGGGIAGTSCNSTRTVKVGVHVLCACVCPLLQPPRPSTTGRRPNPRGTRRAASTSEAAPGSSPILMARFECGSGIGDWGWCPRQAQDEETARGSPLGVCVHTACHTAHPWAPECGLPQGG